MKTPFEWMIGMRYLLSSGRSAGGNRFLSVISGISLSGVALGVAVLLVVLSVMLLQDLVEDLAHDQVLQNLEQNLKYIKNPVH